MTISRPDDPRATRKKWPPAQTGFFWGNPLKIVNWLACQGRRQAEVAELVDARDLKSRVQQWTCGFDSRLRHHICFSILSRLLSMLLFHARFCNIPGYNPPIDWSATPSGLHISLTKGENYAVNIDVLRNHYLYVLQGQQATPYST